MSEEAEKKVVKSSSGELKKKVESEDEALRLLIEEAIKDEKLLPKKVHKRDMVEGTVIKLDRYGVLVDMAAKAEGLVPRAEVSQEELNSLKPGDKIMVYVLSDEDEKGGPILSIKRTRQLRKWLDLERSKKEETPVECTITEVNNGGVLVDIDGISGFIPTSQLDPNRLYKLFGDQPVTKVTFMRDLTKRLGGLVGDKLKAKVIEINREINRVILSEKLAVSMQSVKDREETLKKVKPGDILDAVVTAATPIGLFVNAQGLEGLVHISEISWDKVENPADFHRPGDKVKVMLIGMDTDGKRVAYSIKRLQKDPWEEAIKKFKVGQVVEGTVTKVVDYGAFVKIGEGLNGLIHISELSDDLVLNPNEVVSPGQRVKVTILTISPEERHLGLSLRRVGKLDKRVKAKKVS